METTHSWAAAGRPALLASLALALAACGADQAPVQSASAQPQVFRGGQAEVRFRCGSESLRARVRQGTVQVQVGSSESATLVPVTDPRAEAGHAYGDGKLTLYKVGNSETWMLAKSNESRASACQPEARPN
jgi:membrane-bound inhibitor of C-type lysozyme